MPRNYRPVALAAWGLVLLLAASGALAQSAPAASQQKAPRVPSKIAHVRMSGTVHEGPPEFSLFGESNYRTLSDWLRRLASIRNDDSIAAVALEVDSLKLNWAQSVELADAVSRLNKVKPVYAHLTSGGVGRFLVASAGKEVTMEPGGGLSIIGLGAELMFFRGTLDHLRLKPQLIQVGRYKGASEPFDATKPSKETLETYNRILDDLYDQLCGDIAANRRLEKPAVRKAIDEGPLSADAALKHKLVDHLVSKLDWNDHVRRSVEGEAGKSEWLANYARKTSESPDLSNPFALLRLLMGGKSPTKARDPSVAIVFAEGMIVSGDGGTSVLGQQTIGARALVKCFESVRKDDNIKAVVFRINSPGGSALASELIYQAVRKCAQTKPVIVSVSGMAASGGYYLAAGGNTIIADPPAIIGSIGVLSGKIATSGTLEWLGITRHEITRGRNAGLGMSRPWNAREQAVVRKLAEGVYKQFTARVVESRGRKIKDIDKVAQGRIFTARQAVANGLIDAEGGLNDAIAAARKAAGLEEAVHYLMLPRARTIMDLLSGDDADVRAAPAIEPALLASLGRKSPAVAYWALLAELLGEEHVLAAVPYYVVIRP